MNLPAILRSVETRSQWIEDRLRELVLQESPSEDRAAVNAAMSLAEQFARPLEGRVKRHKQKAFGDILELRFGPARYGSASSVRFDPVRSGSAPVQTSTIPLAVV